MEQVNGLIILVFVVTVSGKMIVVRLMKAIRLVNKFVD